MAEIKAVEHPTLKVPYEILNKKFRIAQKTLDRELSQFQNVASELEKGLNDGNQGDISRLLGNVVERLQVLKRKADESIMEELTAGYECKRRLDHLRLNVVPSQQNTVQQQPQQQSSSSSTYEAQSTMTTTTTTTGTGTGTTTMTNSTSLPAIMANQWKNMRLDRMIVEHLIRLGHYESAEKLAIRSGTRSLTNLDIFHVSREVEEDLKKQQTTKCSAWCVDNKSKLRKINSTIEFQLRVQEFVELIRADRRVDAVMHARKMFSPFEPDHLDEIRQYMGLLAFPLNTEIEPYKSLFDQKRWTDLIMKFRFENYRLFQLSSQSVLGVAVQAGLSALKTPQCYSTCSKNLHCPVCQPNFNEMALNLPFSHCAQSRLICRVTGVPLNEHNLPMMLPNGQVFGQMALQQLSKENGVIVCPQTNQTFQQPKIEKVFVM